MLGLKDKRRMPGFEGLSIVVRFLDRRKFENSGKKRIIKGRRSVNTASRQRIIAVYSRFLKCHWAGAF